MLIKLTLVMGAVLLGGADRFLVIPGLIASLRSGDVATDDAMRRFTLIFRIEVVVLVAVMLAAAIFELDLATCGRVSDAIL